MTHTCMFPTAVRLLNVDTLEQIVDFHDPDNGVDVGGRLRRPAPAKRQARLKWARTGGSYAVGPRVPDDGVFLLPLLVYGSSWTQVTTRFLALFDVIDAVEEFYLETELSGVTHRYYCDAPVEFGEVDDDRGNNRQRYDLSFLVQPSPVVTIGA